MEVFYLDLLKQSPGLITCVIIVMLFLKFLSKIGKDHNSLQKQTMEIIKDNSQVIGETKEVLSQVESHLQAVKYAEVAAKRVQG